MYVGLLRMLILSQRDKETLSTYRSCEVGADATDARAESPGSDGGIELDTG